MPKSVIIIERPNVYIEIDKKICTCYRAHKLNHDDKPDMCKLIDKDFRPIILYNTQIAVLGKIT